MDVVPGPAADAAPPQDTATDGGDPAQAADVRSAPDSAAPESATPDSAAPSRIAESVAETRPAADPAADEPLTTEDANAKKHGLKDEGDEDRVPPQDDSALADDNAGNTAADNPDAEPAAGSEDADDTDQESADAGGTDEEAMDEASTGDAADADADEDEEARADTAAVAELCTLMTGAADRYGVPQDFFIRLIWKESRFNPNAVSPVGAQGIAQFMPGTARIRGLKNPFDREEALFASAHFLSDLKRRLGSWGLAAAGYNGGPNRVPPFVAGEGGLPYETIDYVFDITGRSAQHWALRQRAAEGRITDAPPPGVLWGTRQAPRSAAGPMPLGLELLEDTGTLEPAAYVPAAADPGAGAVGADPFAAEARPDEAEPAEHQSALPPAPRARAYRAPRKVDCPQLVARLGRSVRVAPPSGGANGWTPWGAQVAGHIRRDVAMRQYGRVKGQLPGDLAAQGPQVVVRRFAARGRRPIHAVMFAAASRGEAEATCRRVSAARVPCVVVRNR
ncbi:transglycosylase SLT domain-containing protein [Acuticoccus yangtzensis]|uniref:transglycosylase SLT domain-containing protein n=1 Tax=Acuticoccus yangtzensis TaxID=1443441 RepID=UPI000949ABAD|nr:transglycosylase SLT domain-containing protein [Acuticoccus yangtzensis]